MLEQKIYDFIKKYNLIQDGDRVVIGVSGGPDSICLLEILNKISAKGLIKFEIFVAHVNHGIRENAIIDEEFVKKFCEERNIKYFVKHSKVMKIAEKCRKGLEETGRTVRYEFFDEISNLTNSNKIAIAHNSNDVVETVIMNILRGTGIKGLIGIERQNGKYIRPLIEINRNEIEKYLESHNLQSRHDESNDDNIYTRNKIRNIVIPYIQKEFNPNIIQTINRLSAIVKEEEEYLNKETEKFYNEICIEEINISDDYENNKLNNAEIIIDLKKFNNLGAVIQKRIIFYSINRIFGTTNGIEKIHIDDIIKLCNNNIGNKYLLPNKYTKIVIQKKQLKIIAINA